MAKIASCSLRFQGKFKTYEVHYTPKDQRFFVKFAPEIVSATGINPQCEKQGDAERKGQEILDTYEKLVSTRRRVILVYTKGASHFACNYNGLHMRPAAVSLDFHVCDEISVNDERKYKRDNGTWVYFSGEDMIAIAWSEERERFFVEMKEMLRTARTNIVAFLAQCAENPAILDRATPTLMMKGEQA